MRPGSLLLVRPFVAALVGAQAPACSTSPELPKRTEDFAELLEVGDQLRSYPVPVPAGNDGSEPQPLLLALHVGGEGATGMRRNTGLDATADEYGFVVVYPDGIDRGWSAAETMRVWTVRDRCDPSPTVSVVFMDPAYGIVTRREAYPGCTQGVEVELYAMEGAGHFWPTVIFPVNDSTATFLLRHRR